MTSYTASCAGLQADCSVPDVRRLGGLASQEQCCHENHQLQLRHRLAALASMWSLAEREGRTWGMSAAASRCSRMAARSPSAQSSALASAPPRPKRPITPAAPVASVDPRTSPGAGPGSCGVQADACLVKQSCSFFERSASRLLDRY